MWKLLVVAFNHQFRRGKIPVLPNFNTVGSFNFCCIAMEYITKEIWHSNFYFEQLFRMFDLSSVFWQMVSEGLDSCCARGKQWQLCKRCFGWRVPFSIWWIPSSCYSEKQTLERIWLCCSVCIFKIYIRLTYHVCFINVLCFLHYSATPIYIAMRNYSKFVLILL